MTMNPRKLVPTQEPGILDFAPGAAAAYSLRSLSNSYAGPVVTVRRSTDSAEADFTASEVSDGTLAAWCGGGDGFVKQWWSQTGSNHASQSTTGYQPRIVNSGTLETEGGKAAVRFDGSDDFLKATGYKPSGQCFVAFVHRLREHKSAEQVTLSCHKTATPSGGWLFDCYSPTTPKDKLALFTGLGGTWVDGVNNTNIKVYPLEQIILTLSITGSQTAVHQDGAVLLDTAVGETASGNDLCIGNDANSANRWAGINVSELLIYPTDQTALRTRIEGNLAWYY